MVHSVMRGVCPGVEIVDLGHEVPPHDVRGGAAMLERAVPYITGGVVLAVVDPGVGGSRRPVAVAAGPLLLVGPDNGLLPSAADALGGIEKAVEASDPSWWLPERAGTFDARDVFGPVAAHLAAGVPLERIGPAIDPSGLVRLPPPVCETGPGGVTCEVVWVDRFGNAALSAGAAEVDRLGPRLTIQAADGRQGPGRPAGARRAATFSDLAPGELGVIIDSSGQAAVVLDRASAAAALGLAPGDRLLIGPA